MTKLNNRQLKIYRFIRKNTPVANKQILEYLKGTSRITVVRDLEKLIKEELIEKTGKGRNVTYKLTLKDTMSLHIDPEEYFEEEADERILINNGFNFEIFKWLSTSLLSDEEIKKIERLNTSYNQNMKKISSGILKKEIERLTIELSWKSSKIEGNTYTLIDTEILIKEHTEAKGHNKQEAIMILNHKKAIDFIFDSKEIFKEISVAKIENLHTLITGELNIERNIRKRLVGITGTKYKPIDNEFQIREALQNLCDFINDPKIHPAIKSMMTVLLISYIQPFEDGNKRTARLMGNAILLSNNYCPLSYRSIDVKEYKKATLLFYEQNNISYFKQLFIEQFEFAVNNYFG